MQKPLRELVGKGFISELLCLGTPVVQAGVADHRRTVDLLIYVIYYFRLSSRADCGQVKYSFSGRLPGVLAVPAGRMPSADEPSD